MPNSSVSGTVANTIPQSFMGRIVEGNCNLVVGGTSTALGNAFLYNIVSGSWKIFDSAFGGTDKLRSAYGIWQNGIGITSYTIAGTGYAFASIARNPDNSFGPARWTGPLSYPGSAMTTGNTMIGNEAIGIYTLPSDSTVTAPRRPRRRRG